MCLFWPVGIWVGFAVTQIRIMTMVTMIMTKTITIMNQMLLVWQPLINFMTGIKYSYRLTSWLRPYASAQALLQHGHLLITDDYDSERPLYEFRSNAFGVGGAGVVGFELRTKKIAKKYKLSTYVEGGYAAMTPLQIQLLFWC